LVYVLTIQNIFVKLPKHEQKIKDFDGYSNSLLFNVIEIIFDTVSLNVLWLMISVGYLTEMSKAHPQQKMHLFHRQ